MDGREKEKQKVSFFMFLKYKRSFMCILCVILSMITMLFYEPSLSIRLKKAYHIKPKDNGAIFAIAPFFYALTSGFIGALTKRI